MRSLIVFIFLVVMSNNAFSESTKLDSLTRIIETSTDTVKGNALFDLAIYYYEKEEYYTAIIFFKQSIEFIYSNEEKLAETKSYIGLCYFYQGNYSLSLEYYFKGLEIREELGKMDLIGTSYNNIGGVYYKLKKYEESINFYNKSLLIAVNQNDSINQIHIENNLALLLNEQGKYKEALLHYLSIKNLSTGSNYDLSIYYNNIGTVYLNLKEFEKAESSFKKAIEISETHNNKYIKANSYLNLANLFAYQNRLDKVSVFLYKSLKISKNIGANYIVKNNYKGLSRYYIMKLEADSALKYNNLFLSINDSLLNKYSIDKITELETKYNFEKQEQQIKQLKIENEYSEAKNRILIIIFIFVLLITLGLIIIFYLKRKRNISDKFIVKQNVEIVNYQEKLEDAITEENEEEISKYEGSSLSDEMKVILELAISKLMKKEKLYLKNDFSLDELADKFNTSRSYISQVVNSEFGQNFNSYINELRIKEAMRIMSKSENQIYTINAISKNVGFNSISSFNTAFKKVAGVTPSFFNKSVKNK